MSWSQRYRLNSCQNFVIRYRNGIWQFNNSGKDIHRELYERFDHIEDICIERLYSFCMLSIKLIFTILVPQWRVSDDTILHIAVAQGKRFIDN